MKKLLIVGLIGWACLLSSVFAITIDFSSPLSYYNTTVPTWSPWTYKVGFKFRITEPVYIKSINWIITWSTCKSFWIFTWNGWTDTPQTIASKIIYTWYNSDFNIDATNTFPWTSWLLLDNKDVFYYFMIYSWNVNWWSSTFNCVTYNSFWYWYLNSYFWQEMLWSPFVYDSQYKWTSSVWFTEGSVAPIKELVYYSIILDSPDIKLNNSTIVSDITSDFNINRTGGWTSDYNWTSITITWERSSVSSVIQWLTTLNYTWLSFNIGTNYSPYISWNVFYVPNPAVYTWPITYVEPLEYSWSTITSWNVFAWFMDNISRILFTWLPTWVLIFAWLTVFFFIWKALKRRR